MDKINIGYQTVIRENNSFGGMDIGKSVFKIGYMSHIHQKCLINTTMPVTIGNNTAIGGGSYIFTHSSWQCMLDGYPCTFEPITIGNNVWISWNVFILPSVEIGNGTLVSASSVVTKSLPEKCLAGGNPAKPIIPSGMFPRELHPDESLHLMFTILKSFKEYLMCKGISVTDEKQGECFNYVIIDPKGKKHNLFFVPRKNDFKEIKFTKSSVILSIKQPDSQLFDLIDQKGISLIDISNRTFWGDNDLGKELVKYLIHYGIRLKHK